MTECKPTYLSVDKLDIMRALSVAVAGTVLGTSVVSRPLGLATIGVHLGEIDGTVEAAWQIGDINVKGDFLVVQVEHLVAVSAARSHEVDTRADVFVGALSDEVETEGVAGGGDTIGTGVISTFQSAVCGAIDIVGAVRGVPGVASVAVGIATDVVDPSPVRVKDDRSGLGGAGSGGGTFLECERRVDLRHTGADLLGSGTNGEEGERKECGLVEHDCSGLERMVLY